MTHAGFGNITPIDGVATPDLHPVVKPCKGTPGVDYILTEDDRAALNGITLAVEFLMVAARAISRGFPKDHPEVTEYLQYARIKMTQVENVEAKQAAA